MGELVKVEKKDGIAYVTIDRQEALNALNDVVIRELYEEFTQINDDLSVGCVILTGAGRSFVAGADIAKMNSYEVMDFHEFIVKGQQTMHLIENLRQPVIAAVNGFALGGGCELSMSCDMRIASSKAKFGQPEVGLGIIPGFGGTQRLPRLVGKGNASYLLMTGEVIGAEEAYRMGLVQKVVEPEELMPEVERIAKEIVKQAPISIQMAKRAVNVAENTDIVSGVSYEAEAITTCFQAADRKEGMDAFQEKRTPTFTGK